jgi:hypothetical protein
VESFVVRHLLDAWAAAAAGRGEILVLEQMDCLVLQRLEDALRLGMVRGVAGAAHADPDPMCLEQGGVRVRGIVPPAIRVVHQPRPNRSRRQRHSQRSQRQLSFHLAIQRPAGAPATGGIQEHRQVHKFLRQAEVGHVCDPQWS